MNLRQDERGFLLIVTMLILVVLTIIGLAALDNSTFEVRIAANDRWSKVSFNLADGSVYSTGKLISEAITGGSDPAYGTVAYTGFNVTKPDGSAVAAPHAANDFYKVVMGYVEPKPSRQAAGEAPFSGADFNNPAGSANAAWVPDFVITPGGGSEKQVAVTIASRSASIIAGGGAEFGAGAAGAGVGAGGAGAAVTFDVDVVATAGNNTKSRLSARYRKVLGSTGGL